MTIIYSPDSTAFRQLPTPLCTAGMYRSSGLAPTPEAVVMAQRKKNMVLRQSDEKPRVAQRSAPLSLSAFRRIAVEILNLTKGSEVVVVGGGKGRSACQLTGELQAACVISRNLSLISNDKP